MMESRGIELVREFFPGTGSTYDNIVNLCTIGFDRYWKNKILQKIPRGSTRIMDQACGTGILTLKTARKFPDALIVGIDVTEEYLAIARGKAVRIKQANVHFILGRAEYVRLDQSFDCIISSYLAKYAELDTLVKNIGNMLRGEGVAVFHDFTYPPRSAFSRVWELYFKLLKTAGARMYPQWRAAFEGLPGLLRETRWTEVLRRSLQVNGFSNVSIENLTFGTSAIITATKLR